VARTARSGGGGWPRPRKRLGQHFLTDAHVLARIADALAPTHDDVVVEIGAGRGALTAELIGRAGRVIAIELDGALATRLAARYAGDPRLTVVASDVLDLPLAVAAGRPDFLAAGNVPYYVTTPIIFHALRPPLPRRSVFLVQREVGERVVASPGAEAYGALSVNVQAVAIPTLLFTVSARAFTPPPTVESALLHLVPRQVPVVPDEQQAEYSAFVIAAFGLRRKQMRRVLRTLRNVTPAVADAVLAEAGVAPADRPEVLTPEQFAAVLAGLRRLGA
jgi:16S rRNA (adenine1518-N6/adenine1519-N6)-dimethyltransferase